MFWFVVAAGILLLCLVFFLLGRKLVSKDRECNRKSMSGKTRICYALGFISAALASYTIYFWFEDYLFYDEPWDTLKVVFGICVVVAILLVLPAFFYLVVGPIRYPNGMRRAENHVENQIFNPTQAHTNNNPAPSYCPQCGNVLNPGQKFCTVCGTQTGNKEKEVSGICGFCGEKVESGKVYCSYCGHRL